MSTPKETPQQLLSRAVEAAKYGIGRPTGPVKSFPGRPASSVPDGIASPDDLLEMETCAEPVSMPRGKKVWVHALSPALTTWVNIQASKEVRALNLTDVQTSNLEYHERARVYQVICACRTGQEPDAPQVYHPDHAEALRFNLTNDKINEIVEVSDRLGVEGSLKYEQVLGFFGYAGSYARILLGKLNAVTPESLQCSLEAFASCVTSVAQRGSWTADDVEAMRTLVAEPFPEEPAPSE